MVKPIKLKIALLLFLFHSNFYAQDYVHILINPQKQQQYALPKNEKLELKLSGKWGKEQWQVLMNKIKINKINNVKICLSKDFVTTQDDVVDFLHSCHKVATAITIEEINLEEFVYDNSINMNLVFVIFDNLEYFNGISLDLTEVPMNILMYLEQKIRSLGMNLVSETQDVKMKNGKTMITKIMTLKNPTGVKKFQIRNVAIMGESRAPQNYSQMEEKEGRSQEKNSSYILSRAKMLLKSTEIHEITKSRIKELIGKLENMNDKNPQNESERSRIFNILENICGINILREEDKLDSAVNKMFWALKNKEMDKVKKIKEEVFQQLWSNVEITKSNQYAAEQIMTYISEIVSRRLLNDPEYQEKNKIVKPTKQESRRFSILLHGAPGLGETKIPQEMAQALGIPYAVLNAGDEKKFFGGGDNIFVGAEPGAITRYFKSLCGGDNIRNNKGSTTMIFIIDEVDKYPTEVQYQLLNLFDPSQNYIDQNLKTPPQIDNAIYCLTANNIQNVIAPLRDRCLIIEFPPLSLENKLHIAKKDLINAFGEKNLIITKEVLEIIVRHSKGAGARQLKQNIAQIVQYMKELNQHPVLITEEVVNKALLRKSKIKAYDINRSDVGYMNCIFTFSKRQDMSNKKENGFTVSYVSCCAFEENKHSGDNVNIDPYNQSTIAIVKVIQPLVQRILHSLSFSTKSVSISVGSNKLDYNDKNSFYSCLMVIWISAVTNRKIKPQRTIIAAMLPNGQLLEDRYTEAKIERAYQAGIRYIVVAKNQINTIIQTFNLYSVQEHNKKNKIIRPGNIKDNNTYIPFLSDQRQKCLHPGLEI